MPKKTPALSKEPVQHEDITSITYPGQVDFQTGRFIVTAYFPYNSEIDGGIVAEFDHRDDALNCAQTILSIDPAHEPVVSEIDWKSYKDKTILDSTGKDPAQVSDEIKRQLSEYI